VVDVQETFEILDDVELPPAKAVAARKKKQKDPLQREKEGSLETNRDSTGLDDLGKLLSTPSTTSTGSP